MEIRAEFLTLVLACAGVTALGRVLPLVALSQVQLPGWLADWLRYVPVAVLSALLSIELLGTGVSGLAAIGAAFTIAFLTGNLLATAAAGVAVYWLLG